jgi:hypothetical protein
VVRSGMEWNGDVKTGVEVEICRCARTLRVPLSHHGRPIRQWGGTVGWRDGVIGAGLKGRIEC